MWRLGRLSPFISSSPIGKTDFFRADFTDQTDLTDDLQPRLLYHRPMVKSNGSRPFVRIVLGLALIVGLPVGGLGLYWLATLPDVTVLANTNPTTTALIDARRQEAKENGRPYRVRWTWIPLHHISSHLRRAVIVSEDAAFFQHEGFDWEGIKEATVRNLEAGELQRGGSTITQQLAKNLYLTSEKSLTRKATEALITRQLEHKLAKKRILELYLNVVEWGEGVFGAEAAARHHFGKSASELTPQEAALLAAILPAPRANDPLEVTPYLLKRQRWILKWMNRKE